MQSQWPQAATTPAAVPPGQKPDLAAAPAKAVRSGMGDGSYPDPDAGNVASATGVANPAGQVAAALQAAAPSSIDLSALAEAVKQMLPEFAKLSARLDVVERGSANGDGAGSGDERESDSGSYSSNESGVFPFVQLTRQNPHWIAKHFKDDADQQPRKQDLHTYPPWDQLTGKGSRHEGGGALGATLQYMEPACAHLWEAQAELSDIVSQLGTGDLSYRLGSICVTIHEIYNLVNEHRQLTVEQVRAIGSEDPFDKAQSKHLLRTFRERAEATADVPDAIAEAKASFSAATQKQRLYQLAKVGASGDGGSGDGGGGGGGGKHKKGKKAKDRSSRRDGGNGHARERSRSRTPEPKRTHSARALSERKLEHKHERAHERMHERRPAREQSPKHASDRRKPERGCERGSDRGHERSGERGRERSGGGSKGGGGKGSGARDKGSSGKPSSRSEGSRARSPPSSGSDE
jgi:hypothetical protein